MADLGLTELDKRWYEFTSKYVEKLNEAGGYDWSKLTEDEQELAALYKLDSDMYNGGFIQFFCNWGFDCYTIAIRSLAKLNASECLGIITKQYSIIKRLEEDERLKALWDIPQFLTEMEIEEIDKLNHLYWANKDNIIEQTFDVYKQLVA
ncbi:DUF4375 domain-containing protein [Spirosoma sp. HMF4905]|uniref:DUF4375 domain-containing protein n=1 Tax=Spirosoma arboris TaxID=2682092 RepID=A0A7K1S8P7_9BACT|nr:DUF4375 domain-containing protein [Spirosoma arboris]MVM30169.1 DUF4375 domain-containing protein [Spirosoma arboris]